MIVERNEFLIKFGKIKEALVIWKEIIAELNKLEDNTMLRILTDLTGQAYSLVIEFAIRDFVEIGLKNYQWGSNDKVAELYQKFVPLCKSSERTLYKIEA